MLKKIIQNAKYILKNGFQMSLVLLSLIGTYFTLLNPDMTVIEIRERIIILVLCFLSGYCMYSIWIFLCRTVTVYEEDDKKIIVEYGDFIDIIRKYETGKDNAIFVVPVNRCFDTIVDDVIVEKRTVHGQVVKFLTDTICSLEELNQKIEDSLGNKQCQLLTEQEKDKGKRKRYPVGTIAEIKTRKGNVIYFLSLTAFKKVDDKITVDTNINMHDYLECLQSMVDYCSVDGINLPVYVPTIGCGLSRLHISIDNSIRQLISIWRLNHDVIHRSVHIVVYKKYFWNIHIMKFKKER